MKHNFRLKSKNDLQNWRCAKHSAPRAILFSQLIHTSNLQCKSKNSQECLQMWNQVSRRLQSWNARPRAEARLTASYLFREEIVAGQDEVQKSFFRGTVQRHSHQKWFGFGRLFAPPQKPPALTVTPDLHNRNVCSTGRCVVLLGRAGRAPTKRTSQRSSERFWIASATAVRRRAMTERGSSLPITALPDTIMLAPAWSKHENTLTVGDSQNMIWILYELILFPHLCTFMNGVRTDASVYFNV